MPRNFRAKKPGGSERRDNRLWSTTVTDVSVFLPGFASIIPSAYSKGILVLLCLDLDGSE
jgi:hypothetical protein